MAQRRYTISTTAQVIANFKASRNSITIGMLPVSVEAGNTGRVHIGKGYPPTNTVGDPTQGDILEQGGQISDVPQFESDKSLFTGAWWAIASTSGQVITVDET